MSRKSRPFKKGYWVICRYAGDNGDLIAGRVESVRTNGKVLLTNLLTGKLATKDVSVLKSRNVVVDKVTADKVMTAFKSGGKKEARSSAVLLAGALLTENVPKAKVPPHNSSAEKVIKAFRSLSVAEQAKVSRELWGEVLAVFGVD